ncbi:YwiB family protein [Neobacillus thermocopriae]|uniref:DUF1934 domain-containing protein n=1 Tax=Neobacillus thermocopriae TaxID=1215031 RepID=A0A6B3TRE6_9BACI|nr:DUF1934 domain-containing protein [Neobacillus thermocopriae]MED3623826.1 DUF1934 domain-containing protein [Neobacillus thermocopriae]MED3713282.1 DUF1934 domain-containing protein [Neobacillus thermocopriae]NEX78277.1 DUF1934 domain-containing protein [Neobacillus thermocopriae]
MEIPVKIKVKTTIDREETIELLVFGRFFRKENASFLQYDEVMEEGTVKTIVKWTKEEVLILRSGAIKMRLPFQLNRKLNGRYQMPFGVFQTTTLARKLDFSFEKNKGQLHIVYDFEMQGEPAGTYQLEISFQEEHTK